MATAAQQPAARRMPWHDLMQASTAEETDTPARHGMRTVVYSLPAHVFDALYAEAVATGSSFGVVMSERLAQSLRDNDLLCTCEVCGAPIKNGEPRVILWEGTACTTCAACEGLDKAGVSADAALPGADATATLEIAPSEAATCWTCAQDCGNCATEDGV